LQTDAHPFLTMSFLGMGENSVHYRGAINVPGTIVRAGVCPAALDVCRAALARGPLIRDGNHWRYGRRRFNNATVKRLIEEGTAVRDGRSIWSKISGGCPPQN